MTDVIAIRPPLDFLPPPAMLVLARRPRPHTHNKGRRFPADPPPVEAIASMMAACTPHLPGRHGELTALRNRALIAVMWRTGLRISEAVALEDRDMRRQDLAVVVRHGKGDKRRITAMDEWGWRELEHWQAVRNAELPPGAIFCVVRGTTAGRRLSTTDARRIFRETAERAGVGRRVNPHSLRHAFAVELWREGIPEYVIQQSLGHARLDVTATYLRGIAPLEIFDRIGHRQPPMMRVPGSPRGLS